MKKNVELTEKGTVLGVIIVLCIVYMIGFLTSSRKGSSVEFTRSDIQAIECAMEMYGDSVIVTKDKDGSLILNLGEID